MPINDWFKQREGRKYTVSAEEGAEGSMPDGVWRSCPQCKRTLYQGEVARSLSVCPHCGHHFPLIARDRIEMLVDSGTFEETDADLSPVDALHFTAGKPYAMSLEKAQAATGMRDAALTGRAEIHGMPVMVGALDSRFIGGSMGSVVGERIARAFDRAVEERRGVVMVVSSGGARMQEGMLSLMQMAKTANAAVRLGEARLPYVSVLVDPTYGGVTASFAVLADVILAEPGAMVGFAGPKVVEQATRRALPKGFQTAESLQTHGMIDETVPRAQLRQRVSGVLAYLMPPDRRPSHGAGQETRDGGEA